MLLIVYKRIITRRLQYLQFELDFSLISCMVSSEMRSVWYLDSGASFHVTGDKEFFISFQEKDLICISKWVMTGGIVLPGLVQ